MMGLALLPLVLLAAGAGHPLRDRADRSFSPVPFGTMRSPAALGLREVRANNCHASRECDWADARGVRHTFWERDELVVKSVMARDMGGRTIAALGIHRARARSEVIANVRAFLPEVEITCAPEDPGPGDPAPAATRCDGGLDQGWFRIWFDAGGQLTEVRLDARHFT